MKQIYPLTIFFFALLMNNRLLAQCGAITISTNTNTTELNCKDSIIKLTANDTITAKGKKTYLWNTGDTTRSINVNIKGIYTITFTYKKGNIQCTTSSSIIITEDFTPPLVTTLAIPDTICKGQSTTLVGLGALTYTWMVNNQLISSSASFTDIPDSTTTYIVEGTGMNGCKADTAVKVKVNLYPDIDSFNVSINDPCEYDSVKLYIHVQGDTMVHYQWYENTIADSTSGKAIPNATDSSLYVTANTDTSYYYCIVSGNCGHDTSRVSNAIKVYFSPVIIQQPSPVAQTVCANDTIYPVNVQVATGDKIQWYENSIQKYTGSTLISGATNSSYTPKNDTGTTYYYCVVSTLCDSIVSNFSGAITVNPIPSASIESPGPVCENSSSAGVLFTGSGGTAPYTFKYGAIYPNADSNRVSFVSSQANNNTALVYPSTSDVGTVRFALINVKDANGCVFKDSAYIVKFAVKPLPSALITAPQNICANSIQATVSFNASNGTAPYTFVYNINGLNYDSITTKNGDSSAFVTVSTDSTGTFNYNLISVTDANGCTTNTFKTTTVAIKPLPDAFISGSNTTCLSDTSTIFFTGSNGTAPYTFIYNINGGIPDTIATSAFNNTYALDTTTQSDNTLNYNLVSVSDSFGCTQMQNDIFTVKVNPLPSASINGTYTVCQNSSPQPIEFKGINGLQPYTFTYNINGQPPASVISDSNGKATVYAPTTMQNSFRYNLVSVSDNNGCFQKDSGSATITVTDAPALISQSIKSICNNDSVNYLITASDTSTTFFWKRLKIPGVSNKKDSGTNAYITEKLHNTTDSPLNVKYDITLSNGQTCIVNDSFSIIVNPTPVIDSVGNYTYCNGDINLKGIEFTSPSPNVLFKWTGDTLIGFGNKGDTSISGFIATNNGKSPVTDSITVNITIDNNKCSGKPEKFIITVNPSAISPGFSWLNLHNDTVCAGAHNINFNVISPDATTDYLWRAAPSINSGITIKDYNDPNTVISFNKAGTDTIYIAAKNQVGLCGDTLSQIINVINASGINERKIILKQPGNLLVYPDNTMQTGNGYQWGYDSILSNASDTSFGLPKNIAGQVYQFFTPDTMFLKNGDLDTTHFAFWVLLQKGDCFTKVYYNGPYASQAVQAPPLQDNTVSLIVIPNPNNGVFEINLKGNIYGTIDAGIYNTMGQLVFKKQFTKTSAELREKIEKPGLSNGVYYLRINSSDTKKAAAQFIIQH